MDPGADRRRLRSRLLILAPSRLERKGRSGATAAAERTCNHQIRITARLPLKKKPKRRKRARKHPFSRGRLSRGVMTLREQTRTGDPESRLERGHRCRAGRSGRQVGDCIGASRADRAGPIPAVRREPDGERMPELGPSDGRRVPRPGGSAGTGRDARCHAPVELRAAGRAEPKPAPGERARCTESWKRGDCRRKSRSWPKVALLVSLSLLATLSHDMIVRPTSYRICLLSKSMLSEGFRPCWLKQDNVPVPPSRRRDPARRRGTSSRDPMGARDRGLSECREIKKVGSGGPVRAVAFPQADAGLPDPTFFISRS
jgi:hypothetical protein